MAIEPNDPRLTALLLDELSDAERAALEAKVAASQPLAESMEGLRHTTDVLRRELAAEPCPHLTPAQQNLVLREIAATGTASGASTSGAWGALLASVGWGPWGAWVALAAAGLLVVTGLFAWHVGWNRPDDKAPVNASARDELSPGGGTQTAVVDRPAPLALRSVADPPVITVRVGESLPLKVFGRLDSDREVRLDPGRLTWSAEPLAGFVDFDPQTLTLTGWKVTRQPVVLTVHLGAIVARARVRVIDGEPPQQITEPGASRVTPLPDARTQ
jgi:hypothetical protein